MSKKKTIFPSFFGNKNCNIALTQSKKPVGNSLAMYHQRTTSKPRSRTVHGSGRVRFVPNPNSTPMDSGGEKFNPQPTRFEFQVCRFGSYWFRVHIGRFRVRQSGAKSGRILAEILPDLVRSSWI